MSEIRHIVYDIGKVLIHYDPDLPFSRIIPDPVERRWFFDNVCTSEWNIEQDRGRTWEEAEALLIADFPEHENSIRAFRRHWHDMVPHAYDDSVALMEGLVDAGHDVTMLTNWASDTFREARGRFPFLEKAAWRNGFRRHRPDQARPPHLRPSRSVLRSRPEGFAVHRRQPEEC